MIVSHKHRFVLLAPWKTASQTAHLRLQAYNESTYPRFYHFNRHLNRVVHQHITCADFLCLPESKYGYFVGAFVRNPYDRAYSGFYQLQRGMEAQRSWSYPTPWIRDLVMKQWAEIHSQFCRAEFEFDKWIKIIGEDQIYDIGRNSSFGLHPAHYWTHVAGEQVVNFIGRVERFEADFQVFLSHVEINRLEAVNSNVADLEGSAASNPFGYRYVDRMKPASIDKINRLLAEDFDLFGYEKIAIT